MTNQEKQKAIAALVAQFEADKAALRRVPRSDLAARADAIIARIELIQRHAAAVQAIAWWRA
jgi:hypothetical protein